jgi:RNA polymerase sigma factor (sigma-70 family)
MSVTGKCRLRWTSLKRSTSAVLLQTLGEISPRERTAVVLRHYQHMNIAEIAECMELVESSVRATLSRAMNHLRTTITALNHY